MRRATTKSVKRSHGRRKNISFVLIPFLRSLTRACVLVGALTISPVFAASEVEIVSLEVSGSADSESLAVKRALLEAIGRVNGRQMAALERLDNRWEENSDLGPEARYTSDMQNKITSLTNGAVESYELLSRQVSDEGWVSVRLSVRVAKLRKRPGARLSLAVQPFTAADSGPEVQQLARVFTRALSARLTGSRRFEVIDRQEQASLQSERDVTLKSKGAGTAEKLRVTADLSADLLISGTIEAASFETRQVHFEAVDRSFELPEGHAQISYMIRNVGSGEVRFAGSDSFQFKGADFADSPLNESISPYVVIAQLASKKIARRIVEASYPLTIVAATGSALTLNQGGDLVEKGSVYNVYENGAQIFDPYTQESIGREEHLIGSIEITQVSAKASVGEWLASGSNLRRLDVRPGRYICRLEAEAESHAIRAMAEARDRIEEAKEALTDDW